MKKFPIAIFTLAFSLTAAYFFDVSNKNNLVQLSNKFEECPAQSNLQHVAIRKDDKTPFQDCDT